MGKQSGDGERDGEARRNSPVVADDEVPPEGGERSRALHAATGASR
jgi:hypothetical protein